MSKSVRACSVADWPSVPAHMKPQTDMVCRKSKCDEQRPKCKVIAVKFEMRTGLTHMKVVFAED